jgi:hypothetical protein
MKTMHWRYCISEDMGYTWTRPEPWGYTDGSLFHSPSSYSNIIKHSNGRYYWFGNICPTNPDGNRPRFPIVVGEIDPNSLKLIKDSVTIIDDRREDDEFEPSMGIWTSYEDRETGDIVMRMGRVWFEPPARIKRGHAYLYRLKPD